MDATSCAWIVSQNTPSTYVSHVYRYHERRLGIPDLTFFRSQPRPLVFNWIELHLNQFLLLDKVHNGGAYWTCLVDLPDRYASHTQMEEQ